MFEILLVDNETVILEGLYKSINWNSASCRVAATARDGREAIGLLSTRHFDIVVSDIRMPQMDGLELASWIHEKMPFVKVIILTGFPDFEYAQKAINFEVVDFVLKPTGEETLLNAVEKAKKQILDESEQRNVIRNLECETEKAHRLERNLLINDLIHKSGPFSTNARHRLEELGIDLHAYYAMRVGLNAKPDLLDYSEYICQAQEVLKRTFEGCTLDFVLKGDRFFYVILSGAEHCAIEELCKRAIEQVSEHTDFLMVIGLSRRHIDPMAMKDAILEADNAQMFAEYTEQIAMMSIDKVPILSGEASQAIAKELKILESAIEHQARSNAEKSLQKLFQHIQKYRIPFSSVMQISAIIWSFCNNILLNYSFPDSMSDSSLISSDQIVLQGSMEGIQKLLQTHITYVLDRIGDSPTNIDSIVHTVRTYVDQNYNLELSLETLAEKVHLSSSYLSRLFKKEIGQNLSSYIQNIRIERAKVLLRSTMLKTYEVAEAVGIGDPVYFSKMFKKATGVKPKDYRASENA